MKRYISVAIIIFLLGISVGVLLPFNKTDKTFNKILSTSTKKDSTTPSSVNSASIDRSFFKVTKIVDGDTIVLENGETVRYIGINSAERNECFAFESEVANTQLVQGEKVRLEKDISERDRYQRLLRYVYLPSGEEGVGEVLVNDYLVRHGFAKAYPYAPDTKFKDQIAQAQEEAKNNKLGLWNSCTESVSRAETKPAELADSPFAKSSHVVADHDCKDFKTHTEAQLFFQSQGSSDVHKLDSDRDGIACESLP